MEPQLQRHPVNKERELDCREGRLLVTFPAARPTLIPGSCLLPASSCKSPCLHIWQLPTHFLWPEHLSACRDGRKASHTQGTCAFAASHVVPCVHAPPRLLCSWPGGLTQGSLGWVRADLQPVDTGFTGGCKGSPPGKSGLSVAGGRGRALD